MKIVIPTDDKKGLKSTVAEHFGRCETYTFLDQNGKIIEIINNTSEHMGGTGLPPEIMKRHGANVLLCKGLGPRALQLCEQLRIDVYVCQAETVKKIFLLWKNKKIKKADFEDVCEEHRI
jgi:predicted Fe-Mo cluster-binding NifX family protein